eukprot:g4533.t1
MTNASSRGRATGSLGIVVPTELEEHARKDSGATPQLQVLESSDLVKEIYGCATEFRNCLGVIDQIQSQPVTWNLISIDTKKLKRLIDGDDHLHAFSATGSSSSSPPPTSAGAGAPGSSDQDSYTEDHYMFCKLVKQALEVPEKVRAHLLQREFFQAAEALLVLLPKLTGEIQESKFFKAGNNKQKVGEEGAAGGEKLQENLDYAKLLQNARPSRSVIISSCMEALGVSALTPTAFLEAVCCLVYFSRKDLRHFVTAFVARRQASAKTLALPDQLIAFEATYLCLHDVEKNLGEKMQAFLGRLGSSAPVVAAGAGGGSTLSETDKEQYLLLCANGGDMKQLLDSVPTAPRLHFPRATSLKSIYDLCEQTTESVWSYRFQSGYKETWASVVETQKQRGRPLLQDAGFKTPGAGRAGAVGAGVSLAHASAQPDVLPGAPATADTLAVLRQHAAGHMTALIEACIAQISNPLRLDSFEPQLADIVKDVQSLPIQYAQNERLLSAFADSVFQLFSNALAEVVSQFEGSGGGGNEQGGGSSSSTSVLRSGGGAGASPSKRGGGNAQFGPDLSLDLYQVVEWAKDRKKMEEKYHLTKTARLTALLSETAGKVLEAWLRQRLALPAGLLDFSGLEDDNVAAATWGTLVNKEEEGGQLYQIPLSASPQLMDFLLNTVSTQVTQLFLVSHSFQAVPDDAAFRIKLYLKTEIQTAFRREIDAIGAASAAAADHRQVDARQLQLLFDAKYLTKLFDASSESASTSFQLGNLVSEALISDPVDRLLYSQPMDVAVSEFLEATSILLSPLFPYRSTTSGEGENAGGGSGLVSQQLGSSAAASFTRPDHDAPLCTHAMRFPLLPIAEPQRQRNLVGGNGQETSAPGRAVLGGGSGGAGGAANALFQGMSSMSSNFGWKRG